MLADSSMSAAYTLTTVATTNDGSNPAGCRKRPKHVADIAESLDKGQSACLEHIPYVRP